MFYRATGTISSQILTRIFVTSLVFLLPWGHKEGLFLFSYKWRSGSFRSSKIISDLRLIRHRIPSKCATIRRDMVQRGKDTTPNGTQGFSLSQYALSCRCTVNLRIKEWETKANSLKRRDCL